MVVGGVVCVDGLTPHYMSGPSGGGAENRKKIGLKH